MPSETPTCTDDLCEVPRRWSQNGVNHQYCSNINTDGAIWSIVSSGYWSIFADTCSLAPRPGARYHSDKYPSDSWHLFSKTSGWHQPCHRLALLFKTTFFTSARYHHLGKKKCLQLILSPTFAYNRTTLRETSNVQVHTLWLAQLWSTRCIYAWT